MALPDISKSTTNIPKRFYVGNLFHDVCERDLKKLFDKYGSVANVEIKNKEDIDGNRIATYAFVTIDMKTDNSNAASQCIRDCNNLKWKKNIIKVQVAQESFLTRLEKERQVSLNTTASKKVNIESNRGYSNYPKNNADCMKNNKEDINIIKHSDEAHKDSNFTKKDNGRQQNGTIEFPSDDENESLEQGNNQKKIKPHVNSRKVYHSSSDEEIETNTIKKLDKPIVINKTKQPPKEIIKFQRKEKTIAESAENKLVKTHNDSNSNVTPPKPVQKRKQYYSSSSDEEEDSTFSRKKLKKITPNCKPDFKANNKNASFLAKLESFDSFWQDEPNETMISHPNNETHAFKTKCEDMAKIDGVSCDRKIDMTTTEESKQITHEKKARKGKSILEDIKNHEQENNVISSFSSNMLRFDPNDEKHKKYDLNNSAERQFGENCAPEKGSEMTMQKDEKDKKFWMSSAFASDLTAKMKQDNSNQTTSKATNKSSFSFNFNSAESVVSGSNIDKSANTNITKSKGTILQDDSSDDEYADASSNRKMEECDKFAQTLKPKYTELNSSEKFGLKLKEKAVFASVFSSTDGKPSERKLETFFFLPNDKRLEEGLSFIRETESMDDLRTKFEEKRPILAEILRKKMRNKVKKQEKNSFGGSLRRLKNKKGSFKKKFKRHTRK